MLFTIAMCSVSTSAILLLPLQQYFNNAFAIMKFVLAWNACYFEFNDCMSMILRCSTCND